MKIAVISDTHGDVSALQRVAMIENDADLYLHCGDVECPPGDISPFAAVHGNCDGAYPEYPFRYEIMTPFGKLHMEHYPIYGSMMFKLLKDEGVKIFLHGHTHEREEQIVEGIHVYNPGSLVFPHDSPVGTYLILNVTEKVVDAKWKTIED
jgi:putative phosphoesterase